MKAALAHPGGAGKSDSAIAKHVGCSAEWVRQIRGKLVSSNKLEDSPIRTVTRNGTTYQQDTANIGRNPTATIVRPPMATDRVQREVIDCQPESEPRATATPSGYEITAKARMIDGLSVARGICQGLTEVKVGAIRNACSAEELQTWAATAHECAKQLRAFGAELSEGGGSMVA